MTLRYERVVIGVGTGSAVPAIELARVLQSTDAAVMLVHVETGLRLTLPSAGAGDVTAASLELLHAARLAVSSRCELVVHQASSVARGLHEIAERERADLIVVGAGRSGRLHGVHGVLHRAPCAVAVAPRGSGAQQPDLRRVGVAYLPTLAGRHGLEIARDLVDGEAAELHAITVVPIEASPWLGPAVGAVKTLALIDGTFDQIAKDELASLPDIVGHVADGDPVEELVRFSETIDLLVIGARTSGAMRRLVAGSTSEALCDSVRCPLLVVGVQSKPAATFVVEGAAAQGG